MAFTLEEFYPYSLAINEVALRLIKTTEDAYVPILDFPLETDPEEKDPLKTVVSIDFGISFDSIEETVRRVVTMMDMLETEVFEVVVIYDESGNEIQQYTILGTEHLQ